MILWLKAFHVIFMVTWFAGLFYLPRLFVYHTASNDSKQRETFELMERKLFNIIMTPSAVLTTALGLAMIQYYGMDWFRTSGWLHAKITLVFLLYGFHVHCWIWMRQLKTGSKKRSEKFFRIMNEVPSAILIAAVILAVVKPF